MGTVVVLADDLIWGSRLMEAVTRAGGRAVRLGSQRDLDVALRAAESVEPADVPPAEFAGAIVDLFGHRYDGVLSVARIAAARLPVIAVAEHDDQVTRKRALAAGAARVFSYNKFFTDGPSLVAAWLSAQRGEP